MRYKRVLINGDMLIKIMKQGASFITKCVKGLPEGTQFRYAFHDIQQGIWLVVEHESFENIEYGSEIPLFERPEFEDLRYEITGKVLGIISRNFPGANEEYLELIRHELLDILRS